MLCTLYLKIFLKKNVKLLLHRMLYSIILLSTMSKNILLFFLPSKRTHRSSHEKKETIFWQTLFKAKIRFTNFSFIYFKIHFVIIVLKFYLNITPNPFFRINFHYFPISMGTLV